jgi:sugar phosphate isomerase/epimerase
VTYSHKVIDFTAAVGCRYVTTHIGEPPHDLRDLEYAVLVDIVRELGQHCAELRLRLGLETGQESGRALMGFVGRVGLDNVGVNFDPANIVLYGTDDPLAALDEIAPRLFGAHCKDGLWPAQPEALGRETLLGQGEAQVCACVHKLIRLGYVGPLIMEVGAGPDRMEALSKGKAFLEECLARAGV